MAKWRKRKKYRRIYLLVSSPIIVRQLKTIKQCCCVHSIWYSCFFHSLFHYLRVIEVIHVSKRRLIVNYKIKLKLMIHFSIWHIGIFIYELLCIVMWWLFFPYLWLFCYVFYLCFVSLRHIGNCQVSFLKVSIIPI